MLTDEQIAEISHKAVYTLKVCMDLGDVNENSFRIAKAIREALELNDKVVACPECKGCKISAQSSITKLIKEFASPPNPQYFASDLAQHLIDNGVKVGE